MISITSESDSAIGWPKDGQDMAEIRPDVGQNSSEAVELLRVPTLDIHYTRSGCLQSGIRVYPLSWGT